MLKLKYVLILFVIIALYGCGIGNIPKEKESYIGVWTSATIGLQITKDGKVNYKKVEGTTNTSINAPIQKFIGNNFEVGALGITTVFVVSKIPHEEEGVWKMTVDNVELTKIAN